MLPLRDGRTIILRVEGRSGCEVELTMTAGAASQLQTMLATVLNFGLMHPRWPSPVPARVDVEIVKKQSGKDVEHG